MLACVNGQFIPADRPALTVNDRSFLYGDGLFEAIRITNGQPFLWKEHLDRLQRGAAFLKIPILSAASEIEEFTRHLLAQNDVPEGMVRIHLSRGPSERGYSLPKSTRPTLVITTHKGLHESSAGLKLITSTVRVLADDPLAQFKTANRLPNIRARHEADAAGDDEAILLNHRDEIAEASAANIFCIREDRLLTPPLSSGAVAGTTRGFVLQIAANHNLRAVEEPLTIKHLKEADAVFLTSARWLATAVVSIDAAAIPTHHSVDQLRRACEQGALGNSK